MLYSSSDGFAERLKTMRQNCGFTQEQMANALSIHRSTYAYYELGRSNPPREIMEKLVHIFHISYDELLGNDAGMHTSRLHSEEPVTGSDKIYNLSKAEQQLMVSFRVLTQDEQEKLLNSIRETVEKKHPLTPPEDKNK